MNVRVTRALTTTAAVLAAGVGLTTVACGTGKSNDRVPGGNAEAGRRLIVERFGCGACHVIGGIETANGQVGPTLRHFSRKRTIAGRLPATVENVQRWIRQPQQLQPGTIMPDMGVTPAEARDITAYLYTQ